MKKLLFLLVGVWLGLASIAQSKNPASFTYEAVKKNSRYV